MWYALAGLLCLLSVSLQASQWTHYGSSQKGGQYSSLEQINSANVSQLEPAWIYRTGELGQGAARGYSFQSNPILVEGRLYLSTGSGIVMALEPATGAEIWRYDPGLARDRWTAETGNRGVSS